MSVNDRKGKRLTVHLSFDRGELRQPARDPGLQGLELALGQGGPRLEFLKGFLEIPVFFFSELFLLGGRVLQLGGTTLKSVKLGFQPGYLLALLRELGLVALSMSFLLGCAEITMSG